MYVSCKSMHKKDIHSLLLISIMSITNLPVYHIDSFQVSEGSFYANDLASHLKTHEFTSHPHGHDFYLCILFTKGTGVHVVDFTSYRIKPGTVFMLNPGQFHSWKLSKDIAGYVFFHTPEFYNLHFTSKRINHYPFFNAAQNTPVVYLETYRAAMERSFKRILNEYRKTDSALKFPTLLALIDLLYLDLTSLYLAAGPEPGNASPVYLQKIAQLNQLIDTHFLKHKSAGEYAELMHISAKHLNRICREILGKTTTDLIAERTVLEAKRMLIHSEKSTKEIAAILGFNDPSYFMRLFKKHSNLTPAAFVKSHT